MRAMWFEAPPPFQSPSMVSRGLSYGQYWFGQYSYSIVEHAYNSITMLCIMHEHTHTHTRTHTHTHTHTHTYTHTGTNVIQYEKHLVTIPTDGVNTHGLLTCNSVLYYRNPILKSSLAAVYADMQQTQQSH